MGCVMSRRHEQSGVAAVEFAMLLVPMLTILFGITELGRVMYEYNAIAKAARDAARLMSTQAPSDPDYPALANRATCLAVYGNAGCTGAPLLPGMTTAMVSLCDPLSCAATHANVATGTGVINLVTVTIGGANNPYTFNSLAPFGVPSFAFGPISVTMRQVL
jgi:Flp pilus assembly protein TadG